jgi:hypothetical protein
MGMGRLLERLRNRWNLWVVIAAEAIDFLGFTLFGGVDSE